MRTPYYESTLQKEIKADREDRHERIRQDIEEYGKDILESDEFTEAYEQTHHMWSTVGEHTMRVTATSVLICYALRKLHIPTNVPAVVIGALCHDLGILGRYEKFRNNKEAHKEHPRESVKVAKEIVSDLPDTSEDIIERHMWPAGGGKAPSTMEGIIVSVADKYSALKDLVKGSEVNNTGIRNEARTRAENGRARVREFNSRVRDFKDSITEGSEEPEKVIESVETEE